MNELSETKLLKPLDKANLGGDVAALNHLIGFLNDPRVTGADSTPDAKGSDAPTDIASAVAGVEIPFTPPGPAVLVAPPVREVAPPTSLDLRKFFLTGKLCSGKDFVASKVGATIEGFSVPLYALATHFFGIEVDANTNKDSIPGMRAFLQTVGNWGRGTVSAQYPVSPARATFIAAIRSLGAAGALDNRLGVMWGDYGWKENIWLNAALYRVQAAGAEINAITNVRFPNEFKRLTELGWANWHVMTHPKEWEARLAARKLKPDAAVLKDNSEALAAQLDAQVVKEISARKSGPKLRVVWNSNSPVPSARLWTLAEFMKAANATPLTTSFGDDIVTGE